MVWRYVSKAGYSMNSIWFSLFIPIKMFEDIKYLEMDPAKNS